MAYYLKIPEPCNEDWNKMTPTEKGKYCKVCKKEIFDFRFISDQEIIDKIRNDESICAIYRSSQLNKPLRLQNRSVWSKIGLAFGLSALALTGKAQAQRTDTIKVEKIDLQPKKQTDSLKLIQGKVILKGQVFENDTADEVPGAKIVVRGYKKEASTGFYGKFELELNIEKPTDTLHITISALGFTSKEMDITNPNQFIKVNLNTNILLEGSIVGTIVVKRQNFFQRIGNLFRRKHRNKKKDSVKSCKVPEKK